MDEKNEIKIKPSKELIKFILNINFEKYLVPENISNILQAYENTLNEVNNENFKDNSTNFLENDQRNNQNMLNFIENTINRDKINQLNDKNEKKLLENEKSTHNMKIQNENDDIENLILEINDVKWIKEILYKQSKNKKLLNIEYLNDLLDECDVTQQENESIPTIIDATETKTRHRKQHEGEKHQKEILNNTEEEICDETNNLENFEDDSMKLKLRILIRQLFAILQFVLSIIGGFIFGFIGIELIVGPLDYGFCLLLGVIFALTIALSEIYFLAKKLVEYDDDLLLRKNHKEKIE